MAATIDQPALEILKDKNFAHIGTKRKDGTLNVVPVWVDVDDDGNVVLNGTEDRGRLANARRESDPVTVTVQNLQNPYEWVSVTGPVVEDTHEGARDHINRLAKKYLGEDVYPGPADEQRVVVKIRPERVKHHQPN